MSYGYSLKLAKLNKAADKKLLGVRLGAVCIKKNVPVAEVAERLNVSRQSVYNWFTGLSSPKAPSVKKIEKLISKLGR